jgi:mono/diheme cytochrome c family protein
MKPLRLAALGVVAVALAFSQSLVTGNAQRGAAIFKSQNCIKCHSVNVEGGRIAPDLGRIIGRDYSPVAMASLMWNHAPAMWAAMETQAIAKPKLTEQEAADLFAYFYAARYFDKPGDAGRGKQVFMAKHCAQCHGLSSPIPGGGNPVIQWQSLSDPILLAEQMWNHGAEMRAAFEKKKIKWPQLTSQDLTDLLVYLQNLPQTKGRAAQLQPPAAENGQSLFQAKGCAGCHKGKLTLENRYIGQTLTGFAAAMWNHEPKMKQPPPALNGEEMRAIVAYLWTAHLFSVKGNPDRGRTVFTGKKCASCHNDSSSGAPDLKTFKGKFHASFMVSALWAHGPAMQQTIRQKGIAWPRFKVPDMSDLIAYLNSR